MELIKISTKENGKQVISARELLQSLDVQNLLKRLAHRRKIYKIPRFRIYKKFSKVSFNDYKLTFQNYV